jgi:transcriptional regulator with XRE-family HTH domain
MCCLLQREAAAAIGIATETYINWEKDRTRPTPAQFRPVIDFLGFDPTPRAETLAERLEAKRRMLGVTFDQVAQHLGWDRASLFRYVRGIWRMKPDRRAALEEFLAAPLADLGPVRSLPKRRR